MTETLESPRASAVAKQPRKGQDQPADPKTFALRFDDDPEVKKRIVSTAKALGLDPTSFLRMLVRENLAAYERRVERMQQGAPEDEPRS